MFPQKIKIILGKSLFMFLFATGFASCSSDNKNQPDYSLSEEKQASGTKKGASVENVFYNIPSPVETASMLKKAVATYDKDILNPIENKDKYSIHSSRALNLGVYGTDLGYTTIFDKSQESMLYLACAKKLADELRITSAFDDAKVERMEANMNNRDSLLNIISVSYQEMDAYLQESDRDNISILITAGGWIEGLYIAMEIEKSLRKTNNNQDIIKRISEQKFSLENLIVLLESTGKDELAINLAAELKELKLIFDGTVSTEAENNNSITQEQVNNIADKIGKIRTGIIQ